MWHAAKTQVGIAPIITESNNQYCNFIIPYWQKIWNYSFRTLEGINTKWLWKTFPTDFNMKKPSTCADSNLKWKRTEIILELSWFMQLRHWSDNIRSSSHQILLPIYNTKISPWLLLWGLLLSLGYQTTSWVGLNS